MTQSSRVLVTLTAAGVSVALCAPSVQGQGMQRATLTVHWSRDTKVAEGGKTGTGGDMRSTHETRETLEALAVFEIPDVDYGGFAAFGYAAGQVTAPDHVQVRGGPRRALPPSRLVHLHGHTTLEAHGTIVTPNVNDGEGGGPPGPPCEVTMRAKGEGAFAAGVPGAGSGQEPLVSFQFTPRAATFTLASMSTFPVDEESHTASDCKPGKFHRWTHDPIAVNFPVASALMPQIAPPWTGAVQLTPTGYSGDARLEQSEGGKKHTTEIVSFTLDLGAAPAGGAAGANAEPPSALAPQATPGAPPTPSVPPSGAPMGAVAGMAMGPATLAHGQITFTQREKQATWELYKGNLISKGGPFAAPLFFSPDGKPPAAGRRAGGPQLMLVVVDRGQGAGIEQLRVIGGPGGDSQYDPSSGQCAVHAQATATGVQGSVDCQGKAGGGVTRLVFSAAP
jgi:hypothetical protein